MAPGTYTTTAIEAGPGVHVFVFRGGSGKPVMLQAETIEQVSEPSRSSVVLSRKGSEVRLDKLLIEGSSLGYEFEPGLGMICGTENNAKLRHSATLSAGYFPIHTRLRLRYR